MILLTVLSYNGSPASGLACTFDELGGTVGRADTNQLVLPDPERTISRVHARIVCRGGRYAVVDNGSNPISVNGQPVGAGREHPLGPGDRLSIGGYVITVSEAAAAPSSDPFADLFGVAAMGLAVPANQPGPRSNPAPAPASVSAAAAPPVAASPALAPGFIPADWDPFARPAALPAAAAAPASPAAASAPGADLLLDLPGAPAESLDALFGLAGLAPAADPFAAAATDPLGGGAAQALQLQPNTAGEGDLLQAFGRPAVVPPASAPDHASELHTSIVLGRPMAASAPASAPVHPVPPSPIHPLAPAPSALPAGAVFSWENPPAEGRVVTLPGVRSAVAAPVGGGVQQPSGASTAADAIVAQDAAAAPAAPAARSIFDTPAMPPRADAQAAAAAAAPDELLAALLQGLDAPGLRLQLDAPTLLLLGQLLRESLRGTVELLLARAALKRELRAQMTMIVARENNPLKFSPTVEVALQHLLGPPTKGFMPPAQAVRDACDDLRAHQLGVMAGMRAALDGVLQRFDPQLLEAKITRKSALTSLIPAARKARLWESFQELFGQLQSEAQDDFDELFGKAFLRAYEDQLDRLQAEPGPH
jgi:type VI secretion system FHA domain protein